MKFYTTFFGLRQDKINRLPYVLRMGGGTWSWLFVGGQAGIAQHIFDHAAVHIDGDRVNAVFFRACTVVPLRKTQEQVNDRLTDMDEPR